MGLVNELAADVKGAIRDPTDEQKAILVAILAIIVVDRYAWYHDIPFVVQTTAAVGAGFIVFIAVSFLISGQFPPDDGSDDHDDAE
ncbi:hypothetical protein [Halopenitus persicus]|uniref:hypothetical protein n=1 Tax=Halopenitus persicus TaxID=1048396 RepID=UPI000BBB604D|nr:hypothetical protein [Halopenitus persicus]